MPMIKRLMTATLAALMMLAVSASAATASQSEMFNALADQVTIPAIGITEFPIRDTMNGIGYADLGYLYAGDHVTVSPVQEADPGTDWVAIRTENGIEGVIGASRVVLLPEETRTFNTRVEVIDVEASGGFVGGLGSVNNHNINEAPSNTADEIREAVIGEVLQAAEDIVVGPGRFFSKAGYRPVKLEDGTVGYVLAKVARPLGPGEQPTSANEGNNSQEEAVSSEIPLKLTETIQIPQDTLLYIEPSLNAESQKSLQDSAVQGTQAFARGGTSWHAVDLHGREFFVNASDVEMVAPVAPADEQPSPEATAGVADRLSDWWSGTDGEPSHDESGTDEAKATEAGGAWASVKDFFGGKTEAASATVQFAKDIPLMVAAGIAGLLSLVAATRAGKRMTGQIAAGFSGAFASTAAILVPATVPVWGAWCLIAVNAVGAAVLYVAINRGRAGTFTPRVLAVMLAAAATAFITATVLGRPVFAAGSLALLAIGTAVAIAPRVIDGKAVPTDRADKEAVKIVPDAGEDASSNPAMPAAAMPGRTKITLDDLNEV